MAAVPPHRLISTTSPTVKGIEVRDWIISVKKGPCSSSSEINELAKKLDAPALPEMIFGQNELSFHHAPTGFSLKFNASSSLSCWDSKKPPIRVHYSKEWVESRQVDVSNNNSLKEYDWTFTTYYQGDISPSPSPSPSSTSTSFSPSSPSSPSQEQIQVLASDMTKVSLSEPKTEEKEKKAEVSITKGEGEAKGEGEREGGAKVVVEKNSKHKINLEELKKPDPILFFDEVILFEDELADNGIAELTARVRVMPGCFFGLVRFWLRVDGTVFRIFDVRVYHSFADNFIVRETQLKEASWQSLKLEDPRSITDHNLIASLLPVISLQNDAIFFK